MGYETINRADAGNARSAATSIETAASVLRAKAQMIVAQVDRLYWTGPIRDRVVPAQKSHAEALLTLASEADSLAGQLTQHASWIDALTDQLDQQRLEVRLFMTSYPEHPVAVDLATRGLPARWNTQWTDIARRTGLAANTQRVGIDVYY